MFNNISSLLTGPILTQAYEVAAWGDIFYNQFKVFLRAFPKLQKATTSFVTSVQLHRTTWLMLDRFHES